MEMLQELIGVATKQATQKIEVIGKATRQSPGKIYRLYEGIIDGVFKNDDMAAEALFGTDASDINYKKLKYRLQNRLINTIFFIDVNKPNYNDLQRAYYVSQKLSAAIDILLGKGARKVAIELAERTLKNTIKFEFTDISLNLLKKLSRHYGVLEKNEKKFLEYSRLIDEYLEIFNAETLAEQYHSKLGIYTNEKILPNSSIAKEAEEYSQMLRKYTDRVTSNRFLAVAHMVILRRYEIENDYNGVLSICEEGLKKFEKKNSQYTVGIFLITSKKINCLIQK